MSNRDLTIEVHLPPHATIERQTKDTLRKVANEWPGRKVHDRPSITLAPGALDDVPLVALIRFLADHGLELRGLTIERAE